MNVLGLFPLAVAARVDFPSRDRESAIGGVVAREGSIDPQFAENVQGSLVDLDQTLFREAGVEADTQFLPGLLPDFRPEDGVSVVLGQCLRLMGKTDSSNLVHRSSPLGKSSVPARTGMAATPRGGCL